MSDQTLPAAVHTLEEIQSALEAVERVHRRLVGVNFYDFVRIPELAMAIQDGADEVERISIAFPEFRWNYRLSLRPGIDGETWDWLFKQIPRLEDGLRALGGASALDAAVPALDFKKSIRWPYAAGTPQDVELNDLLALHNAGESWLSLMRRRPFASR